MIGNYDAIIITADEPYHGMSHTQVLYANFLAKQVPVAYIQAPKKWRPWNVLQYFSVPEKLESGITVFSYVNLLPASMAGVLGFNEHFNERRISKWIKKNNYKNCLVWHFDSYRSVLNSAALSRQVNLQHLYHVIDPYYKNPVDPILRAISKVVVVTSPRNNAFYENVTNKLINIPQCIDIAKEQSFLVAAPEQVVNEKDYLVLLGTISDDCDFDLLLNLSAAGHALVMIGKLIPLHKKQNAYDRLRAQKNVQYLGFLPPQKFYPYLQRAKLGIITYDLSIRHRSFSPLKAINYLIAGLPVISNCDTELPSLKNKAVFEVSKAEDFLRLCNSAEVLANFSGTDVKQYLLSISLENAITEILRKV